MVNMYLVALISFCRSLLYPRRLAANVCVYAVRGIGGLKNEAQRNVKPDLLRTVARYRTKLRKYF